MQNKTSNTLNVLYTTLILSLYYSNINSNKQVYYVIKKHTNQTKKVVKHYNTLQQTTLQLYKHTIKSINKFYASINANSSKQHKIIYKHLTKNNSNATLQALNYIQFYSSNYKTANNFYKNAIINCIN